MSIVSVGAETLTVAIAIQSGDPDRIGSASAAAIGSIVAALAAGAITGALGAPIGVGAVTIGIAGAAGTKLGGYIWDEFKDGINHSNPNPPSVIPYLDALKKGYYDTGSSCVRPEVALGFDAARAVPPPRFDPLILDLNGNGIETVAASAVAPILFDHAGNGIKTGTGWIAPSDGFLALDRNGNGTIDNGTELFGDSTQLAAGGNAADGFAALAGQDSNADGVVNALDANFANLKVWQDLNQDGISQAGELKSLSALGIASLNLAKTANSQTLTGGNQIADLGSFTRTDGTIAVMADVSGRVAAKQRGTHRPTPSGCNLAADAFHRSFTDVIPVSALTATLPDMQGSGMVRDLGQAANDLLFEVRELG